MKNTTPPASAPGHADRVPEAEALNAMRIPDEQIRYPGTAAWQQLGATVRHAAATRRQARARQFRLWCWLSAAAAVVVLTAVSARRWDSDAPQAPAAVTVAPRSAPPVAAPFSPADDEVTRVANLVQHLDLDYVALELTREGVTDHDAGSDAAGQVLAALNVDTVAVYLAAQQD